MTPTRPEVTDAELWAAVSKLAHAQAALALAEKDAVRLLIRVLADTPAASVADAAAALPALEREAFSELYDQIGGLMATA